MPLRGACYSADVSPIRLVWLSAAHEKEPLLDDQQGSFDLHRVLVQWLRHRRSLGSSVLDPKRRSNFKPPPRLDTVWCDSTRSIETNVRLVLASSTSHQSQRRQAK